MASESEKRAVARLVLRMNGGLAKAVDYCAERARGRAKLDGYSGIDPFDGRNPQAVLGTTFIYHVAAHRIWREVAQVRHHSQRLEKLSEITRLPIRPILLADERIKYMVHLGLPQWRH